MRPALRRCLRATGAALVDGTNPAELAAVAGGRQWSKLHAGAVPLGVLFPRNAQALAAAVRCARQARVQVTARAGGGSFMGYSVRSGTLTIDLSQMADVRVAKSKASVVVQAGALLGKVVYEVWKQAGSRTAVVVGSCPNVGAGGHILGGGFSNLTPQFGLACDQLLSLTMVDASGALVTASATHNRELFAASCGGGGGNFGIVTEFHMKLHRAAAVYTRARVQIAQQHALDFLVHWQRRVVPQGDGKLFSELNLRKGAVTATFIMPGKGALTAELRRLGVLQSRWLPGSNLPSGSAQELSFIQLALENAGSKAPNKTDPRALLDSNFALSKRDYFATKSWFAMQPLARSAFANIFRALQAADGNVVLHAMGTRSALNQRNATATGFPWRQALYFIKANDRVKEEADVPLLYKAVKAVEKVVAPLVPGQPAYVGYLDDQASANPLESYYGDNLGWLEKVKGQYDPTGFFTTNPLAIPAPTS